MENDIENTSEEQHSEQHVNERLLELRSELDQYFTDYIIVGYRKVADSERGDTDVTEIPYCFIPGQLVSAGGLLKWALNTVKERLLQSISK
jgi:hypothetical protein